MRTVTRRTCVAGLLLNGAWLLHARAEAPSAATTTSPRVVCLDWASAETLIAIGVTPLAIGMPNRGTQTGLAGFSEETPSIELGSQYEPNMELLQSLRPDLIFCNEWQTSLVPALEPIAPTHVLDVTIPSKSILENSFGCLQDAAALVGKEVVAADYASRCRERLERMRQAANPSQSPILCGTLLPDGRHIVVFCSGCLFDDVLQRIGMKNAWRGPTERWGRVVQGVEVLAEYLDTLFLYLDNTPYSTLALRALSKSSLWQTLPSVQLGLIRPVESEWPFGALPTAMRFASSVATALDASGGRG